MGKEGMITVFFLETTLDVGGSEMMWVQLIRNLDRTCFRPVVCCLYRRGPLGEQLAHEGIPVYDSLVRGRWDLSVFVKLSTLLKREHVEILYVINQPITQFWASLCRKVAGVPVLFSSIHSTGKVYRIRRRLWVNRLTFGSVDCVSALSEYHRNYLVEKERIPLGKIEIVPNGIEIENFGQASDARTKDQLGISPKDPVIGILAMLRPEKAHDIFLKASLLVLERVPNAQFLIIGDGSERERLEKLAVKLGVHEKVHFLGVRHDIAKLLGALNVAVLCSHPVVETLPVSVLEYMASSKPVVATRVGSLPELVEDSVNGFLVDSGDVQSLADRIVSLLENPTLARRMGEEGRKKVLEHYTVDKMVQRHEQLFQKLLSQRRR